METIHENKTFEKVDYSNKELRQREFIHCVFKSCSFEKADLSGNDFLDCIFENCNMSLAKLAKTGLKNVSFKGCKLTGIDFTPCNDFLFTVSFTSCQMDYVAFQRKKMRKTLFNECSIKESHFTDVDLGESVFDQCELGGTFFQDNNLEKADFRTARNFTIDPEQNKMKKAKFSAGGLEGLLGKYGIEVE
ncbi:MAG: pentapeptide repeat-containing protein [Bacteroidota bacterium]|nr:pentapeptide repeat-containing protein [Bacteroidota bacterium]